MARPADDHSVGRRKFVRRVTGKRNGTTESMRLPSDNDVMNLQRTKSGVRVEADRFDQRFLRRMQRYGYLDATYCRTSGQGRLEHVYRTAGLTLFLGAGVSKASGVPDWRALLDGLLDRLSPKLYPSRVRRHSCSRFLETEARLSLVSQFDLVAHDCRGPDRVQQFADRLRECMFDGPAFAKISKLANTIPEDNKAKERHDWLPLRRALQRNATLAAIGELLVVPRIEQFAANPRIHAVLTTNVDNLLQLYTMSYTHGMRLLDTVNHPGADHIAGRIPIYHLHGWLDMRDARKASVSKPPLVFRESEYFDAIAGPNGFANQTAQYFFQRSCVLFVGTSLEDLNVRRWIYNTFEERRRSLQRLYADRYPAYGGTAAEAYAASVRHFWLRSEADLPNPRPLLRAFLEDAMRHLGVEVIWYKEHADVADILRSLARLRSAVSQGSGISAFVGSN